jgi:putative phage-type endonuclease
VTFTVGGSEAAAACGVNPYESRVMLWARKTGKLPPVQESEAMTWGKRLEQTIFETLLQDYGMNIWKGGEFRDESRPWMIGHTDAFVRDLDSPATVVDIKTTSGWGSAAWAEGDAPTQYIVQLHHYMHLTGLDDGLLACLVGGQRLELRHVPRDDRIIDLMLAAEEEFVGFCERDEPPPPVGSDSDAEALRGMFGGGGERVRFDKQTLALVAELRERSRQLEVVKRQHAELKQAVQLAMGDAETAVDLNGETVAKWTTYQRDGKPQRRFTVN